MKKSLIEQYNFYQKEFIENRGDLFWNYLLNKRKLTKEIINRFELGYNKRWFKHKDGEPLIGSNAITIPFRDYTNNNRIIAYQSRFINNVESKDGVIYRYFNTINIPKVYERSKMFYNLYNVLNDYYNEEKIVYVVEGSFDLMALACIGINNAVAAGKNTMSAEQIEILRRYFKTIIFVLDKGEEGKMLIKFKNNRIYDLNLYYSQINDCNGKEYKDVNDMLVDGTIDIKKYIADNMIKIENNA
jgi:DNA primase